MLDWLAALRHLQPGPDQSSGCHGDVIPGHLLLKAPHMIADWLLLTREGDLITPDGQRTCRTRRKLEIPRVMGVAGLTGLTGTQLLHLLLITREKSSSLIGAGASPSTITLGTSAEEGVLFLTGVEVSLPVFANTFTTQTTSCFFFLLRGSLRTCAPKKFSFHTATEGQF